MPGLCSVDGCARPGGRWGPYCRMHYDRRRKGKPLDAPLDPRQAVKQARHGGRSHREALRELAVRLEALRVVGDRAHAQEFVAWLATYWPTTDVFDDGEWMEVAGPTGDASLFGL